ncbi:WD40 repeat-like protein [Rhizodiscina lignyota]|uniref:WD40 repeat-like protein n=1 Tax=Rhizodiscina lignyota TaxID=1504668 RepID=A0A9P4IG97_9PEZI|nr:WD40 repeat-like protein [Rhizodiscina lignyota]
MMAQHTSVKTTFEPSQTIQPFYTGGSVALSQDGQIFAGCMGEDAILTDLNTGKELGRVEGDGEPITSISLTPSASHLIICSRSLSMRIYNLQPSLSGDSIDIEHVRTLKPHAAPVVVSAVDSTGTLLATGGADGVIKVWDIRGGYTTHTFHGHSGVISALHFFQVAAASLPSEFTPKKRRRSKGKQDGDEVEHVGSDSTVGFRLASGGEDCKVRIWNLHKRSSAGILESHSSVIRCLDYSPEENALVSSSRDKTVTVWDARTWKIRRTVLASEEVESCGFVNDGKIVFTGGETGCVRLWSTSTSQEITQEQQPKSETEAILEILHFDTLPYLLSIQADQTLIYHSLDPVADIVSDSQIPPLPILQRISGTHDEVIDLAYVGKDRSYLALATNIDDVRIISLSSSSGNSTNGESLQSGARHFGADVASLKGHEDIIICMDVDWSGQWLATGAKDNTARLWRIDPDSNSYSCYTTFTGHAESIGAISLAHSEPPSESAAHQNPLEHPPSYLVTGSQDKTVKRWEVPTPKAHGDVNKPARATYTRKAHDKDINAIDTNDRGTLFASASQDRTVKIWSLQEGEVQGVLRGHKRGVWTVRFAPHRTPGTISGAGQTGVGRGLVLTGSGDKSVRVWSLADYSCLLTLEGHTNSVLKVVWLPSTLNKDEHARQKAAQVASAGGDGLVKVWDLGTGEAECTLDNHTDRVWALAPRQTPTTLVSGGGDGVLTFWTDTTRTTLLQTRQRETERIEQDQQLSNLIHAKDYRAAITLALQLDQPGRLLSLFTAVGDGQEGEKDIDSYTGKKEVDDVLASLADEQIYRLLLRIRDWNTNARTADVAQRILHTLIRRYRADKLASIRIPDWAGRGGKGRAVGLTELYDGIRAYTERHLRRVEDLVEQSYLLDFTLREMDELAGADALILGEGRNGLVEDGANVLMVED